ncbi:MAG TPA: low affinity iron permease family protein [Candidatus Binatia bacterium]|jgi:low affinity Fe/Cu permease
MNCSSLVSKFDFFSKWTARASGKPATFALACLIVIIWAATGPMFNYSDTWQLVINTGTTIVTFLMVFLIQNTQNRDTQAMQVKMDELIRVTKGAHNELINLEDLSDEDVQKIQDLYRQLAEHAKEARHDLLKTGVPEVELPDVNVNVNLKVDEKKRKVG